MADTSRPRWPVDSPAGSPVFVPSAAWSRSPRCDIRRTTPTSMCGRKGVTASRRRAQHHIFTFREESASKMAVSEAALGELGGLDGVEADGVAEPVGVAGD